MGTFRQAFLTIVLTGFMAQWVGGLPALARSSSPPSLPIAYYCQTAEPLGLTYTDAASGKHLRLRHAAAINRIMAGPRGWVATEAWDESGKLVQVLSPEGGGRRLYSGRWREPRLVGWLGTTLVLESGGKTYSVDVLRRTSAPSTIAPDTVAVASLPLGVLAVREHEGQVEVTLSRKGAAPRRWDTSPAGFAHLLVTDSYAVLELDPATVGKDGTVTVETGGSQLWIIALATGQERRVAVPKWTQGFCRGRTEHELLVGWPGRLNKQDEVERTDVISLDLRTGQRKTLFHKKGQYDVDGLSQDRSWLLLEHPYAEVGPGRLVGAHLPDGAQRLLQENVYACAVVRGSGAARRR